MRPVRRDTMKKLIRCCCLVLLLLLAAFAAAESSDPVITPAEWTWNPGKVATFEGSFNLPENCPEVVTLHLAVKPEPSQSDPGKIVFTFVNKKKLTVKKQSDDYSLKTEGLTNPVTFRGSWFIPEEIYYSSASITFSLASEDGALLAEKNFDFSEDDGTGGNGDQKIIRLPFQTSKVILWACIAAGAVWLAAVVRIIVIKAGKANHQKGASVS